MNLAVLMSRVGPPFHGGGLDVCDNKIGHQAVRGVRTVEGGSSVVVTLPRGPV